MKSIWSFMRFLGRERACFWRRGNEEQVKYQAAPWWAVCAIATKLAHEIDPNNKVEQQLLQDQTISYLYPRCLAGLRRRPQELFLHRGRRGEYPNYAKKEWSAGNHGWETENLQLLKETWWTLFIPMLVGSSLGSIEREKTAAISLPLWRTLP